MKANKTLPFLTISLLLTALSWPNNGMGQNVWEFSLGTVIPVGDFSGGEYNRTTGESNFALFDYGEKGGTNMGFNAGVGLYIPTRLNNTLFCIRGDVVYNYLGTKAKSYLDLNRDVLGANFGGVFVTEKTPRYWNIPIMAGVKYLIPVRDSLIFYIEAEGGMNFRNITQYKVQSSSRQIILDYESTSTLMFRMGFGLHVTRMLSVSLYYYDLGSSQIIVTTTGVVKYSSGESVTSQTTVEGEKLHTTLLTMGFALSF